MKFEVFEPKKPVVEEVKPLKLKLVPDGRGYVNLNVVNEDGYWAQTLLTVGGGGIDLHPLSTKYIEEYGIPVDDDGCIRIS